jgi:hypothetical protein
MSKKNSNVSPFQLRVSNAKKWFNQKEGIGEKTCVRSFKCRNMDFLAEPVSLKYKGRNNVESTFGAFCSFLIVILVILWLGNAVTMCALTAPGVIAQTKHLRPDDVDAKGSPDQLLEVQMP